MSQKEISHTPRPSGAHSSEEEMREGAHIKSLWVKTLHGIRMSRRVEKREKRESWMSPWIRQHLPCSALSCGRNMAPARERMAVGRFLRMRTWARAGPVGRE